ncbi:hypothetical protein SAMN02799631_04328 [Methylobacterium sp. 174MFSha1.1]|uniref:hypothetical protein n=1 Tax=Methylobacterium sp. 174MFSha1.1 TaxID=1502749 RepID=UPI0008E8F066|nr:hypothetical protein [Methylobacterium sp. 174MFSha1.1]SFV05965.1 hypothetical protein SAMN02799631_04328 [Methylobacterium sp. 174MFSha1.1]
MSAGIRMNNLPSNPIAEVFGLSPDGTVSRQDIDLFIQALLAAAGAGPAGLPAEVLRAQAAERAARTLASPKNVLRNDPYTEFAGGAVSDGQGGIRVPAGSRGAGSQIRARFNLSAADIAANAGRLIRFVSIYRVTPGFLTAFKDTGGNVTLFNVADGVQGGTTSATVIQADTIMVEMDAVLAGTELLPAQIFFIGGDTQPLAAAATARLIGTAWFPADATGTTDVLAKLTQPFPSSIGELIAVATVRRALAGGAVPAFADRGLLIPAGQTGASSLLIAGIPAQGLAAGVVVRGRFLFGASNDIEPATVVAGAGATVSMATGPDVGAASFGFTKLGAGVYEGTFTYTMVGGETRFEFFLSIATGSGARSTSGFVRLQQATLEIVSTPLTTTINGQVARYMEQARARLALVPGYRRAVFVAADGSSPDGFTRIRDAVAAVAAAAGPNERNVVYVAPGIYADECGPGDTVETSPAISPADYVDIIGLGRPEDVVIISRFPDNQAGQEKIQPFRILWSGRFANFTVIARNCRYGLHVEAGNAVNRAVQIFEDVIVIHEGATGWASPSAIGVGQHPGNRQIFRRVRARSPYSALNIHNNIGWSDPSATLIEDCDLHGTVDDACSLTLSSLGAGIFSPVLLRNTTLSGHVRLDTSFFPGAPLYAYKADRFEYALRVEGGTPIDVVGVCDVSALTLTSVAGAASAVAISGPGAAVLFGLYPDVRVGAADSPASVRSFHGVDVPVGEVDPGVTLAARLGNRSGSPLSLGVAWDGQQPVTLTLTGDYRGMSNAAIVSALNSALATALGGNAGGRAFSLSKPYSSRPPVFQPDREGRGLNVGTATILHGSPLAWSGRNARLMTSTDATSLFAGFAIGDAVPGRPIRFQTDGRIGQAQLRFDGTPSIQPSDRFQVSASVPGALVEGTSLPLLVVRSTEPHGACFEIIQSVLFTGDTQQAVRDAFASITYRDVPGLADAVDSKAAVAYVDSKTANLLPKTGDGAGVVVTVPNGVPRSLAQRAKDTIYLADYGAVGNGATDDTVAVQKAAVAGDALGGARIVGAPGALYLLSSTIVSNTSNVFDGGVRSQVVGNTNGSDIQPGFYWIGPANGTMLLWKPKNVGDCIWQPGLLNMMLNGATGAAYAAVFDNTKQARVSGSVRACRVAGVEFNSDSGTGSNFSQNNEVEHLEVVYGVSDLCANMHGVIMRGNAAGTVPATQNRVGKIDGLLKNGWGLKILHTDNCQVGTVHIALDVNGTGGALLLDHTPSVFRSDATRIGYVAGGIKIHPAIIGTHFLHLISEAGGIDAGGGQYHLGRLIDYGTGAAYGTSVRKMVKRLPLTLRPTGGTGTTLIGSLFEAILMPRGSGAAGAGMLAPDQEGSNGTLTSLRLYVVPTANTSAGNLRLRVALNALADGGNLSVSPLFQNFTVALPATNAGIRRVLTIPLSVPYTEGQDLSLVVSRVSGDAADTVAQDIALSPQVALTLQSAGPQTPGSGTYTPPGGP